MSAALQEGKRVKPATRILVVEDHPIVREGFHRLIEREPDLTVCGEAASVEEALEVFDKLHPDLVVIDISLQDGSGLDLCHRLKAKCPDARMLVVSAHDESLFAERTLHAGAMGFVNKQDAVEKLVAGIRHVMAGKIHLNTAVTERILARAIGVPDVQSHSQYEALSDRELEVFRLIGQGHTTRQVAQKLNLSPKTVESYRENIKHKLNLANATELTRHAVRFVIENM
jgi:DNA-binding NarL/FixJ family response regulator